MCKEPKRWSVQPHPEASKAHPGTPYGWLCIYCKGERDVSGRRCEPEAPFCSYGCAESYQLRVGNAQLGRKLAFERDRGICNRCGRDCHQLYMRLKPLPPARRRQVLDEAFRAPERGTPGGGRGGGGGGRGGGGRGGGGRGGGDGWNGTLLSKVRYEGIAKTCHFGSLWQADHIKAVADGGGEATSAVQYQTLCTPCHLDKGREDRHAAAGAAAGGH